MLPLSHWGSPLAWRRAGGLAGAALLLSATLHNEQLYALLDAWWQRVVAALGLAAWLPALLRPGSQAAQLMHRAHSIPAVLLYGFFYLVVCLGLLFLLLPDRPARRLALLFYAGAGLATGLLLLASKVGGGPALAALASQLLHFIVSPLPVIMLVPLLTWAASQQADA